MAKVAVAFGTATGHEPEVLTRRHEALEHRLAALERRRTLTPAEQAERTQLKKERLWVKDRLAVLARPARVE